MTEPDLDTSVRLKAFEFLGEMTSDLGEVLPRRVLEHGFPFDGRRVPLINPQGIFKPAILPEIPLTITTAPEVEGKPRPYDDQLSGEGLLLYRYRGTDPRHRDNAGLRRAMERRTPLIYLFGVAPGLYMPSWPVFIVGDEPADLRFTVAVDQARLPAAGWEGEADRLSEARRRYVTRETVHRVHQQTFRLRVLRAYEQRCAICRLRHERLLEAAHILPDGHPRGEPIVPNGLSLCSLHHAAFDAHILGVRPDLLVELRRDVLREADGPMLEHGLQGFHGSRLHVPRANRLRPNAMFLEERYELFRRAS